MNITSVLTTDYENKPNWTLGENKPNQTQSPAPKPRPTASCGRALGWDLTLLLQSTSGVRRRRVFSSLLYSHQAFRYNDFVTKGAAKTQ